MSAADVDCEQRAERALLGVLLAEPDRLAAVAGWLRAEDFVEQRHRVLYAALAELGRADAPAGPEAVLDLLRRREQLRPGHLDGAYLAQLRVEAGQPRNAAAYGRMVLEASIARSVAALADRITQAAAEGPGRLFARAALGVGLLDAAADRWRASGAPREEERPTGREITVDLVGPVLVEAEDAALRALVAAPDDLLEVSPWLIPDDFAAPGRAQAYAALRHVGSQREPFDPVAAMWQARQLGAFAPGGPAPALLAVPDGPPVPGRAVTAARRVLAASIQRHAAAAADTLSGLAARPELPLAETLTRAHRRVRDLRDERLRWTAAHPHDADRSVPSATAAR